MGSDLQPPEHAQPRTPAPTWVGVQEAAAFLGVPVITLRRSLERAAKRGDDGVTESRVDGILARKFGRLWRVRFSSAWLAPPTSPRAR